MDDDTLHVMWIAENKSRIFPFSNKDRENIFHKIKLLKY